MIRTLTIVTVFACACGGCNLFNQHAQLMDTMRGAMQEASARLGESGTGQIQAGGQVIDPGIEVAASITYSASARYKGVAGQVQAAMQGGLDRPIPQDVQDRINRVYAHTALSSAEKWAAAIAMIRAWQREQDGRAPTEGPNP